MIANAQQSPSRSSDHRRQLHGEPFVWLTLMSLVLGLLMIITLLSVVAKEGFGVFWPKSIGFYQIQSQKIGSEVEYTAGQLIKRQKKYQHADILEEIWERQLFVGNKNYFGMSFRFVNESDILAVQYPKDLILVERLEYGSAIGSPVRIVDKNGTVLDASDPKFETELSNRIAVTETYRHKIKKIEKKQIGAINYQMRQLDLKRSEIEKKQIQSEEKENAAKKKLDSIRSQQEVLQSEYEILAREARSLREQSRFFELSVRLADGSDKSIHGHDILRYSFPNRLTWIEKVIHFFQGIWRFFSEDPREANTEGGIFPAIFGTFVMTIMMSFAVTPFGVVAAIYLREYAKQGAFVRMVRIAVNNLAGVPSIVFGIFGLGFFVYGLGASIDKWFFSSALPTPTFGTGGILWASLTLALMTVPVVIVSTEEALAAVPRGTREGSLACGASKWQTIQRVVLPASAPGIMTGFILAMARGAGEVAPLMLVGVVKLAPTLPLDTLFPFIHLERKFMHLGFHIYDLGFQSPDSEAAKPMVFATALILILLVILLNLTAIIIRQKLRKKYSTGAI